MYLGGGVIKIVDFRPHVKLNPIDECLHRYQPQVIRLQDTYCQGGGNLTRQTVITVRTTPS